MTKLEWAKEYHGIIMDALINAGFYEDRFQAGKGIVLHEDLHGQGPSIIYYGDYEILGREILLHTTQTGSNFIELKEQSYDFFAEPENSECIRIYEA